MEDFPPLGRRVTRRSAPENPIVPLNQQRHQPVAPPRGDRNPAPRDRHEAHDGRQREGAPVVEVNLVPGRAGQQLNPAAVIEQRENQQLNQRQQVNPVAVLDQRQDPPAQLGQQQNPAAEPGQWQEQIAAPDRQNHRPQPQPVDNNAPAAPNVNVDRENERVSNMLLFE